MKKILFAALAVTLLASCGKEAPLTTTAQNDPLVKKQVSASSMAAAGDTVSVDYIGKFEDGTVFDSSIKEMAKKSPDYAEGRTYEPLLVSLKEGGTIEGFWKGIIGMKVGEKKTLNIKPEQAYGTEWKSEGENIVDIAIFDRELTRKIPLSETKSTIKMEVEKSTLWQEGNLPKVGDVLTSQSGVKAKVLAIGEKMVSLEIDNSKNPFAGKKIAVGTSVKLEGGSTAVISAVDSKELTVKIDNRSNPFYGKTLTVGLVGLYQEKQRLTIKKIEGKNVTLLIETKNDHKLAGKTLVFDIELKEIKSSAK
jgi:FKBP-type peptidyl-prolyl cis-trans isomerase 2